MDYPRDNVFTFLFSTYKRTAGIAFAAILILAVPVTIALLAHQQDIRQHASTDQSAQTQVCMVYNQQILNLTAQGLCNSTSSANPCTTIRSQMTTISCPVTTVTTTPPVTTTTPIPNSTGTPTPTPACAQRPPQCGHWYDFLISTCNQPAAGWCPVTTTTPTPTIANVSTTPTLTPTTGALSPTPTSTTTTSLTPTTAPLLSQRLFDFNDDGVVDEIDLNILYAAFRTRQGD